MGSSHHHRGPPGFYNLCCRRGATRPDHLKPGGPAKDWFFGSSETPTGNFFREGRAVRLPSVTRVPRRKFRNGLISRPGGCKSHTRHLPFYHSFHRPTARTPDCRSGNAGSIPAGSANSCASIGPRGGRPAANRQAGGATPPRMSMTRNISSQQQRQETLSARGAAGRQRRSARRGAGLPGGTESASFFSRGRLTGRIPDYESGDCRFESCPRGHQSRLLSRPEPACDIGEILFHQLVAYVTFQNGDNESQTLPDIVS